ncbi:MAG: portal protein, partial [Nitrosomonadaceae bacterium]
DKTDSEMISQYREDFERGRNQIEEQRDMCNDDIRFVTTPAAQWEGFLREQFSNRPRFELDMISQAINRFYGEWLTNRSTVKYRPENGKAEKEADILTGLYRKDERRCGGDFAIDNAMLEGVQGGMGAWKISTEYVDEEDEENDDQNIIFDPVYSAHASVVWDPNAKRMDKADAKWCFILHELDSQSLQEQFPDADLGSFSHVNDRREFNWNSNTNTYFIAERYGIVEKSTKAITYRHPISGEEKTYYKDEIEDITDDLDDMGFEVIREKKVKQRYVEKSILGGSSEYLEKPERIPGKSIPIIPFYAYWTYTDGQEFFWGLVRKLKDSQRLFNMQVSSLAEIAATSVKNVPIMTPEQVSGHENNWAQAHLGKKNYQLINPITQPDGTQVPMGPVGTVAPPIVDPALSALIDVTGGHIQKETGVAPQQVTDPDASGKAILAAQQVVNMNTQSIMKNMQKALRRAGQIYREVAADVHTGPKMMTLLGEDDTESTVQLFEQVMDQETGQVVELNDITKDKFEVVVDTGPAYASRRQETTENIMEIMGVLAPTQTGQEYMPALIGMMVENMDGTNLDDLKDFNNKKMIEQGFREPKTDEEKQYLAQLQQEKEGNEQQNPMMVAAQAEMIKGQADMQDAQNKQQGNQIDAFGKETDRMKVQLEAQMAGVKLQEEAQTRRIENQGKQLDNVGKMVSMQGSRIENRRRLLEPVAIGR